MERTINGRPVNEVFQALKEDIPDALKRTEDKNQPYLDSNKVWCFFESHVPPQNYDFLVSDIRLYEYASAACFVCTGRIVIYDDNRQEIIGKSHVGSYNCMKNKDGRVIDMAMAAKNAAVKARKNCICMFGCGVRQLEEAKGKGRSSGQQPDFQGSYIPNPVQTGRTESSFMPPVGIGRFLLRCSDAGRVNELPKMVIVPVICTEYKNYKTSLLIWKNNRKGIDGLVEWIKRGEVFSCNGKFEPYNNTYRIVYGSLERGAR